MTFNFQGKSKIYNENIVKILRILLKDTFF